MDIMLQRILELVGKKHGAGKELCDALESVVSTLFQNILLTKMLTRMLTKIAPAV